MEFTLKQNNQIKTLSTQLSQRDKEAEGLKRTVAELEKLEKATVQQTQNIAAKSTAPANGAPMWTLLLAFICGIIFHWMLLCSKCATPPS